jgi:Spy/CpxP family protein refolding chaperone
MFGGPGGGMGMMGGFGGASEVMLLNRSDVQKELELVDEQIDQIGKIPPINMREMFEQVSDLSRDEQRAKMGELMKAAQDKTKNAIKEILLPHQAERLGQLVIQFQMRGGAGLTSSEDLAKQLNITDEQREKLRTKARGLEQELRKKLLADLLKELTPEQQAKYKELVGEPFEFQQDIGRGGFGGPGGGGPGGGGPGGGGPGGGGRRGGN